MVVGVGRQVVSARTASQLHPTARAAGSARAVVTARAASSVCVVVTARADGPGCRFGAFRRRHHHDHRRVSAAPRGDHRAADRPLAIRRRGGAPGASRTRAAGVSDRLRLRRATGPRRPQRHRDRHEARTSRSSLCSDRAIHSGRARAPQADEAIGTGSAWRSRGRRARSVRCVGATRVGDATRPIGRRHRFASAGRARPPGRGWPGSRGRHRCRAREIRRQCAHESADLDGTAFGQSRPPDPSDRRVRAHRARSGRLAGGVRGPGSETTRAARRAGSVPGVDTACRRPSPHDRASGARTTPGRRLALGPRSHERTGLLGRTLLDGAAPVERRDVGRSPARPGQLTARVVAQAQ
jgi:hypothetical protein